MSWTPADLARMAQQYAQSLQAAGVDWLPARAEIAYPPAPSDDVDSLEGDEMATRKTSKASKTELFVDPAKSIPDKELSTTEKKKRLKLMDETEVKGCPKCPELVRSRTHTVFGVGNVETELVFVGEAPGAEEDKKEEPFVGAAGALLNKIIAACKLAREDVFICNVLKCRPPGNRQPLADEVTNCRDYLDRQLAIIRPRFICCLGSVAAQTILQTTSSIGKLRKQFHDYTPIPGAKVVATYHPAYLLRNPDAKKDVWADMKMLMREMGQPVD
jgi:DNA polymerase